MDGDAAEPKKANYCQSQCTLYLDICSASAGDQLLSVVLSKITLTQQLQVSVRNILDTAYTYTDTDGAFY